jgi:hypothetical protein
MAGDTLHFGPDEVDLWLEGRLPESRASHLETCEVCRIAAEEIREVVLQLTQLPKASPSSAFADLVMARVNVAEGHFAPDELEAWIAGALPARREAHLRTCPDCQALADAERVLVMRLEALPLFDPAPGLADRVLGEIDLPVTSIRSAWRQWRRRIARDAVSAGAAAGVAVLLGGSVAASAAWAAGNQEVILGAGTWLLHQGQQLFWQGVATGTALLQQQPWYGAARAALTPGWLAVIAGGMAALYAGGVILLRRLIALPNPEAARALP